MWSTDFRPLVYGLILVGVLSIGLLWGAWEVVDWLWLDDIIKVSKPLVPEIELIINNGVVDTLYVYRL